MLVALRDSAGRSVDKCFGRRRLGGADEHILCAFNADLEMAAWFDCGVICARRGSVEDDARLDDCQKFSDLIQVANVTCVIGYRFTAIQIGVATND